MYSYMRTKLLIAVSLTFVPVFAFANGTVTGKIKTSANHSSVSVVVTKDTAVCGESVISEKLIVNESGGLKNAVVMIEGVGVAKPGAVSINQEKCRFNPHVLVVAPGTEVAVNNMDETTHNFHTYAFENEPVNFSQPASLKTKKVTGENFEEPEVVEVKCDIHEWMNAWIVVSETSAVAVTGADGSFTINDIPPGSHKIRVWHEFLGEVVKEIIVKDGITTFDLTLGE